MVVSFLMIAVLLYVVNQMRLGCHFRLDDGRPTEEKVRKVWWLVHTQYKTITLPPTRKNVKTSNDGRS